MRWEMGERCRRLGEAGRPMGIALQDFREEAASLKKSYKNGKITYKEMIQELKQNILKDDPESPIAKLMKCE